jgi:hypothetical protein
MSSRQQKRCGYSCRIRVNSISGRKNFSSISPEEFAPVDDCILARLLAEWMTSHRPAEISESVPFHVARRDDIRTRPCVVLNPTESKPITGMPNTARVKLDVHLFSQVDDTSAEDHALWAGKLVLLMRDKATMQQDLDSESFCLHDLIERESVTTPDESRGRETVLSYEAVVSAV